MRAWGFKGAAFGRIAQMPEVTLHLDLLDFEVGDGGEQLGPDQRALVLVDEAGAVEIDEHLAHGPDDPSSMVEALRDQSQEAPSRFSWLMISPPDSSFHCQTRATNSSRPDPSGSAPGAPSICRSTTTICVAMPA